MENKKPVLVVLQLTGGNDFINTVVPYSNPHYYDARKKIVVPEDQVLPIDDNIGFHQNMAPIKELYDQGSVAIIQGIGYPNSSRSHFRALDIWHTCEPETVGTEGWLVAIAVVIWIGWDVITAMQEEEEHTKLAKRRPSSNALKNNVTDG